MKKHRFLPFILVFIGLGLNPHAHALINGALTSNIPAVVSVRSITERTETETEIHTQVSDCTGALVGLKPITVITARHCTEHALDIHLGPHLVATQNSVTTDHFKSFPFDPKTSSVPGDIAVITFAGEASDLPAAVNESELFTVAPRKLPFGEPVSICGFGHTETRVGPGLDDRTLRCGENFVINEDLPFPMDQLLTDYRKRNAKTAQVINLNLVVGDEEKVEYAHFYIQYRLGQFGHRTRFGIGPFTPDDLKKKWIGKFTLNPLPVLFNHGDSGGPWFTIDEQGSHHLVAVSSELHYGEDGVVFAGISWRLDHPWTKALLKKASDQGADIRGLSELLDH